MKKLPRFITAAEAVERGCHLEMEVLDSEGRVMKGVRAVDTVKKLAEQYRPNGRGGFVVAFGKSEEDYVDVVPYSEIRMKDGRDIVEVFNE